VLYSCTHMVTVGVKGSMCVVTAADDNTLEHEELFVGDEVSDQVIVAEDLDDDPDEGGQQEQMEEDHDCGAACRVEEVPPRRDDEEDVQ